ncbi:hypothetical protein [Nitrosomonas oligotropha]|uniref:hypothetical protein n=1 Tax=Nitrosomonas oligotropha TaxID=42354 RepID=UPI0013679CF6|nr:hypothetical protein [Nitrosomonas oligotropha]MXS83626.1 hypothetical protein [Nitrosomonas oligotropha]
MKKPDELLQIAQTAILNYSGDVSVLNSALGMLFTGQYYGWRFLYIVHSKRTVRKYEKVLDIKVTEFFQPAGPLSHRSAGLVEANKHSNFWKCVSGDTQIPNRKLITDDPPLAGKQTFPFAEQNTATLNR